MRSRKPVVWCAGSLLLLSVNVQAAEGDGAATPPETPTPYADEAAPPVSENSGASAAAGTSSSSDADTQGILGAPGLSFSFGGFIRQETAISTSGDDNPYNQQGWLYNGRTTPRFYVLTDANGGPVPINDTTTRAGPQQDGSVNLAILRTRLEADIKFTSNLSLQAKMSGIFDPALYNEYDPHEFNSMAVGKLYGKPNYFRFEAEGKNHPNPLEWSGREYLITFPALFLDYNRGPLDVRIGNQQIAWGQAIFFRVLDVPDGLDLRRHSVLDFASEEFSDKRVPALAVRASYQFADNWLADAYVQKFQPTVYGNPNTSYNVIASAFTVHDRYGDFDSKISYGLRLKGDIGDVGVQAIAVRRYNPDGVFRWTKSGVNRDLPGLVGSGQVLQDTAFEVDPTGIWSAEEWFTYAGMARLNGVTGLNAAINEFPAAALLGAVPVATPDGPQSGFAAASATLDTFFALAGGAAVGENNAGLRGHIAREYRAENNFGGGLSYVINSTPGSLLDQLIVNFEALYTPNRVFTNPSLSRDFLTESELTTALVMEKYQRFSTELPATYMVAQWLHKTASDLFGRSLKGQGGTATTAAPGVKGGYDAVVFALQQPFAQLVWRADLSVLYDTQGGILVQPAVRWKPSGSWTVDMFYNYINGHLSSPNENSLSTFDFADELSLRVGYQF